MVKQNNSSLCWTSEGFRSINSEGVTNVTTYPNFYASISADVGDMLFHGETVRKCHAKIVYL